MHEPVGMNMVRKVRSTYFLNPEKRNHIKKHIRKLSINNLLTTDPTVILTEQSRFYHDLHTSRKKCSNNNAIYSLRVAVPTPRGKTGGRERLRKTDTNRVL